MDSPRASFLQPPSSCPRPLLRTTTPASSWDRREVLCDSVGAKDISSTKLRRTYARTGGDTYDAASCTCRSSFPKNGVWSPRSDPLLPASEDPLLFGEFRFASAGIGTYPSSKALRFSDIGVDLKSAGTLVNEAWNGLGLAITIPGFIPLPCPVEIIISLILLIFLAHLLVPSGCNAASFLCLALEYLMIEFSSPKSWISLPAIKSGEGRTPAII